MEFEILDWPDLPTGKWYRIRGYTKICETSIRALEDPNVEMVWVWRCSEIMQALELLLNVKGHLDGYYLISHGLKEGKSGQSYLNIK